MSTSSDPTLAGLWKRSMGNDQRSLAHRYAPLIRFDAREPFLPLAAGYTIFRESGPSPSFRQGRRIDLAPVRVFHIEVVVQAGVVVGDQAQAPLVSKLDRARQDVLRQMTIAPADLRVVVRDAHGVLGHEGQ